MGNIPNNYFGFGGAVVKSSTIRLIDVEDVLFDDTLYGYMASDIC